MVLNQSEPRAFNARGSTLTAEVRNVGDGAAVSAKRSALSNSSDITMDQSSSDSSDAGGTAASSGRLGLSELIDLIRSQGVEEGVASDEDVELVFSKHASAGTGGKIDVEAVGELMHELLGMQVQNEDPVSKRPQFEALDASTGPHATREMHSRHSASTTSSDRQRLIEQQERVYRLSLDSNKGGDIQRISEAKLKFNPSSPDPAPTPLALEQATAARPMPSFLRSSSDVPILISTGKRPQQPSEVRGFDISVNSKDWGSSLDSSERESFESSFDTSQASAQPPHRHAEPRIVQEFASEIRPGHSGGQRAAFVSGLQGRYVGRASFDDILRDAHSTFQSGFRSGDQNDTSQATSHASESVDDAESLQQALDSAYRAQLESLDGPQGALHPIQGVDASAPGTRRNLFNVITESMAPALSFAVKQADELREENRRLRDDNQRLRSLLGSNKAARNPETLSLLQDNSTEGLSPLPAVRAGEWHAAPGVEPGETSEDGDTRAALIKDIVDLQEQLADAQQELDARDQQLKKAQESVNNLTAEKEALEAERGSFVQEHGALFESELQAALQSAEEAREELQQQKIHAEEQTSLRVRAERDEQKAKELMQDMENEFLQYKHMTSEAKSRADASAADLESEVTALRTEFAVIEDKNSTMQADLLQALTRLKASEATLADTKSQLAAEKQSAIERFKVWESELDERNSQVQKLEAHILHLQRQSSSADDADHLSPDGVGNLLELSGEHLARAASSSIAAHRGAAGPAEHCSVEEGSGLVGRDTERRVKLLEQVHAAKQEASLAKQQHELQVQQRQAAEVTAEELKRDLAACLVEVHRLQTLSVRLSDENATLRKQLLEVRTPVGPANKDADIGEAVPDARTQNEAEHVTEQPAFEMPHQAETPPDSPTMQAKHVSGTSVGAAEEDFSREPRAATDSARRRAPPAQSVADDCSGGEVRGDADTRLVMEGLKDAHTRMQEARQCLQTLESDSQGPLLEAHQLQLQLTRAHKERDEMEQLAVRDRQRVSELRQVIFGLQASSASLGIENERLKSSLADLQDRYESLVQTSANVRLGSLACKGCSDEPGPASTIAQVSDASQAQDVMLASSALPVSASWPDERVRGAYEGMQRRVALLQAESEHEVTKRVQASCLLAQIVAQASPQALKGHAGMVSVGQARPGAPGSLAEVGADSIASGSNEMLPLPEQELLSRQDDEASGLNEWCLSLDNVDRAVRRMTPAQLKNAVEVVRRALVDGTRQRDAWRKSLCQVSVAEVERLHRWHVQLQEEALRLSLEREQLANERKMTSAFHAAVGPLLDNHRRVLQDALKAQEARVVDSFAAELLFLETALLSGSAVSVSSDSRAHAHTASPGQPPVLGGNSRRTPRSTAVPTSDGGAAHRQDKAHQQAAGDALTDESVVGGYGHARRQIPIG